MKMNMLKAAMAVALLAVGVNAHAVGSASSPVTLNATLTIGCSVDTTGVTTNLGTYSTNTVGPTAAINAGTIAVTCGNGLAYGIGIDAGANANQSWGSFRHMANGGVFMPYNLALNGTVVTDKGLAGLDATYAETTGTWGDSALLGLTGNGSAQPYALTAAVYPSIGGFPGTYSDTVNVVVAW